MSDKQWGWSDQLEVKYAPMDATHREFVTLCAALSDTGAGDYLARLDAMIAHSIEHFEQENRWMDAFDFPSAGCHVREHNTVLGVLRDVRERVVAGDAELGARLAEELPQWFEHHVANMDSALAEFLQRIGYDGAELPVAAQAADAETIAV